MSNDPASQPRARVFIVEDHPMFRERLVHLINQSAGMMVCGESNNILEAKSMIRAQRPDLALVDITLRGSSGLELIKDLRAEGLEVPVLVLSMHEESLYAERVLAAGGRGYITKHETSDTVLRAIRQVLAGQVYLSERMTGEILNKLSSSGKEASAIHKLANRELEVFELIGRGQTTREIADRLNLGVATVDTYRGRIKDKLGLRNAVELQQRAALWVQESSREAGGDV